MSKLALIGAAALAVVATGATSEADFDCHKAYKTFWERLQGDPPLKIPADLHVALTRKALRIYDACLTNDVENPRALFQRLDWPTK
jgi:hypothetical protein